MTENYFSSWTRNTKSILFGIFAAALAAVLAYGHHTCEQREELEIENLRELNRALAMTAHAGGDILEVYREINANVYDTFGRPYMLGDDGFLFSAGKNGRIDSGIIYTGLFSPRRTQDDIHMPPAEKAGLKRELKVDLATYLDKCMAHEIAKSQAMFGNFTRESD